MNRPSLYKKKPSNHVGKHTSSLDASSLLVELAKNKALLHFTSLQNEVECFAQISHIDVKQSLFHVEMILLKEQSLRDVMPGAYKVTCVLNLVVYHFEVQIAKIDLGDKTLFVSSFPSEMQTLQRREVYRLRVDNIFMAIEDTQHKRYRGQLAEISVLGFKAVIPKCTDEEFHNRLALIHLDMPDGETLSSAFTITRSQIEMRNQSFSLWGLFKELTPENQNRISQYIIETQRRSLKLV